MKLKSKDVCRQSKRRQSSSRKNARRRGPRPRRLMCEMLEDRRMLSIGGYPEIPGMVLADPRPDQFEGQIIYLDFDGAEDVTYNGPVVVEDTDVPPFSAEAIGLGGHERELIPLITGRVGELLEPLNVTVTSSIPDVSVSEYSTIYIGGSDDPFAAYGEFFGLAEGVDVGNVNHRDRGFVFSDQIAASSRSLDQYLNTVSSVAAHEAGHLLGFAHFDDGSTHVITSAVAGARDAVLGAVAHKMEEDKEVHQWITKEAYDFYRSQFDFGNSYSGWGELGAYLIGEDGSGNDLTPGSPWAQIADASNTYDGDNNIIEGARDEDTSDNPLEQSCPFPAYPDCPYYRHFLAGGDGDEIYDGLAGYDSAYEQANKYWYGWWDDGHQRGLVEWYNSDSEPKAYWYLGHVAHLLQDMTVPAHVHNDIHPTFHEVGDDDEYEDMVGDVWFSFYSEEDAAQDWSIYLPAGLVDLFRLSADYTEDYDSDDEEGDEPAEYPSEFADYEGSSRAAARHRPSEVENDWNGVNWDLEPWETQIVAADLMPFAIEQTAALFRLFYSRVDSSSPDVSILNPLSTNPASPTQIGTPYEFVASGHDAESGVDKDGGTDHFKPAIFDRLMPATCPVASDRSNTARGTPPLGTANVPNSVVPKTNVSMATTRPAEVIGNMSP